MKRTPSKSAALRTLAAISMSSICFAGEGNQPPVCDAGPTAFVECQGLVTVVQLDATASYDPDQDDLTFFWTHEDATVTFDDPTSPTPLMTIIMPEGDCVYECSQIFVTVSDGQDFSTCKTAALVSDTLPPVMQLPTDVLTMWNGGVAANQHDPNDPLNGWCTAVDLCKETAVTYVDDVQHGFPPSGIEDVVFRTWTAVDECGFEIEDLQTMMYVGPSFFGTALMDAMPGDCMNYYDPTVRSPFSLNLLGIADFDAHDVVMDSILLRRTDGIGDFVAPVRGSFRDFETVMPNGLCPTEGADGYVDCVLKFNPRKLERDLMLWAVPDLTVLPVDLYGIMDDGAPFVARDFLIIRRAF